MKTVSRTALAALFIISGIAHFVRADLFTAIVPPYLPWPRALVYISGVTEVALGTWLLAIPWRRDWRHGD